MPRAERSAFETALLSHVGLIRHIGRARLHDRSALDDFTQEVLTSACAYRARHGDPNTLRKWLATVARNRATDWNRKRRPTPLASLPELTAADTPDRAAEDSERWETLLVALDALDPTDRDIVYRRYFQDESYDAIGQRHGLSAEAIGFRLHRSRRRLRSRLEAALAAIGATWAARSRGAVTGAIGMKIGQMGGSAVALGIAFLVALGVGITVLVWNTRDAAADARSAAAPTDLAPTPRRTIPSRVEQAASALPSATQPSAAGPSLAAEGRPSDGVASDETSSSSSAVAMAPEATPHELAKLALDDFVAAAQAFDSAADPDALVRRSSGTARQMFEWLRDWFLADERPGSYDSELAEMRSLRLASSSFVDGELRASFVSDTPGDNTEMVLRNEGGKWVVVEMRSAP